LVAVAYSRLIDLHDLPDDVRQCLDYWEDLRAGRFAPPWTAFDWSQIPAAIIPHMGVVDVRQDPLDFIYRFWGTAHVRLHNREMTGKSVTAMRPAEEARSVFAQYEEIFHARRPALFENRISAGAHGLPMTELSLRLVFSDDGETVHHLMAISDVRKDFKSLQDAFRP